MFLVKNITITKHSFLGGFLWYIRGSWVHKTVNWVNMQRRIHTSVYTAAIIKVRVMDHLVENHAARIIASFLWWSNGEKKKMENLFKKQNYFYGNEQVQLLYSKLRLLIYSFVQKAKLHLPKARILSQSHSDL